MGGAASRQVNFRILVPGEVWAEDHLLLTNVDLLVSNMCVSLNVTEVQELARTDFDAICADFPEVMPQIRASTVRYVFMRGVTLLAKRVLKQRDLEDGSTVFERVDSVKSEMGTASNSDFKEFHDSIQREYQKTASRTSNKLRAGATLTEFHGVQATKAPQPQRQRYQRKFAGDAGQAAAVAWYSPMDAATAATAAAAGATNGSDGLSFRGQQSAIDELYNRIDDLSHKQEQLERRIEQRFDALSGQMMAMLAMQRQQAAMHQQQDQSSTADSTSPLDPSASGDDPLTSNRQLSEPGSQPAAWRGEVGLALQSLEV
eukprot:TRINITY_DN21165_c1_g3_i2.p1 TRINITY_DN21165_c1_g3~~TRINITY_DN21165_c1_g3_i2.p1  ORF type:complete len:316 (-),score=59.02 TRINITY_DN21165_c1_g3_i2:440-1387(-)